MTERELLEQVLAFWDRLGTERRPSDALRAELIQLLFSYRAQGMMEAAAIVRRARRGLAKEVTDPVSRFVLAQVEEELRRCAAGLPPRDENANWLHETPAS